MFPNFSYNEDRAQFIGRDVEGIKQLNSTLADKYQANKQAKIQAEDLLHSINTFDQDGAIKSDAVGEFNNNLQSIVDNGDYENATQVVEGAVTKIKRNEGLRMAGSNFANYQQYVSGLKENPKGWTADEISKMVKSSKDNYSGVQYKDGEAYGTFSGYDPGEKINVTAKLDESLANFAASQGVSVSAIRDLYGDNTEGIISTTTNEMVRKSDVEQYLRSYYQDDPEIAKYYETQTVLNSQKSTRELVSSLEGEMNMLGLGGDASTEYNDFVTANPELFKGDANEDFVAWMMSEKLGSDIDLQEIIKMTNSDEPKIANAAKMQLADITSRLQKVNDIDAAATKNSYIKQSMKHNMTSNDMLKYRLKKIDEDYGYLYTDTGSSIDYNSKYSDGKAGLKLLDSDLNALQAGIDATDKEQNLLMDKAVANGAYVDGAWNTNTPEYKDYQTKEAEKYARQSELDMLSSFNDEADKYADDKLDPIYDQGIQLAVDNYVSSVDDRIEKYGRKYGTDSQLYKKAVKAKKDIEAGGFDPTRYKDYRVEDNKELQAISEAYGRKSKHKDDLRREYVDSHEISTMSPTIVAFDEFAGNSIKRLKSRFNDSYATGNAGFMVRDESGNVVSNPKNRPDYINTTGMSTSRFSDGKLYTEALGMKIVDGKQVPTGEKFYLSATNQDMNEHIGNMLINNPNVKVQAFAYQLLNTPRYRFNTENIQGFNDFVSVNTKDNFDLGQVRMYSSTKDGVPDANTVIIDYKIPADIVAKVGEAYELASDRKLTKDMTFDSRADFENTIALIDDLTNKSKKKSKKK